MRRASQCFTDEDRRRIQQTVADAESKTAAEIVPVVATASGRYDRPEDLVGLWLGLAAMIAVWLFVPEDAGDAGSWGGVPPVLKGLGMVAAVMVGFFVGALAGSRIGWLRRIFTPRGQMHEELMARARQVFFDQRVRRTAGGTGLLLYVSLYERMAAVLGDQAVLEKLGQPALDELCKHLTDGLRRSPPAEALTATIRAAGDRLAPALPRAANDANELPDGVITVD